MEPLTIYPKHPEADAYRVGGFYSPYCLIGADKRFTDAELAAECWQYMAANRQGQGLARVYKVLKRFATHPHFDEEAS